MTLREARRRATLAVATMIEETARNTHIFDDGKTTDREQEILQACLHDLARELRARCERKGQR